MSKASLKKHLQSLSKEEVIESILELYENIKPVKEYFEYYLNPNEKKSFLNSKKLLSMSFIRKGNIQNQKLAFL